jgi:membrane-associated protease RseP (regulator of RpoE activity)
VVVTHELSHGIASLTDHVPLKSTGAFFAHLLMGGFVEPDEEKLNQASNTTKLRVFAAGSFTNAVLGVICILLLANFSATIAPFYTVGSTGVTIGSVPTNLPAHSSGLQAGDIVTSINGTKITSISDLRQYMSSVVPGQEIVVGTQHGSFSVRTGEDPTNSSHALIGIGGLTDNIVYNPKLPGLSSDFPPILLHAEFWLSIVLVSVALINMLPMYPFDGDKFLDTALNVLGIRKTKEIRTASNFAAYSILLLNIAFSFLRFGFLRF